MIKVRFGNARPLPRARDAVEYEFPFTVVDSSLIGAPGEETETKQCIIKVAISGPLAAGWGLSQSALEKVLFKYAKRHIVEKLKDGTLGDREELWLSTSNCPSACPFPPSTTSEPSEASMDVPIPGKVLMQNGREIQLASSIIDARDNCNAVFAQRYKEKLLLIDQERNLLQFFREASSPEEFSYRVAALASIVGNLNIPVLRTITGISDRSVKSISLLEAYLKRMSDNGDSIVKIFRNINRLRQAYPIHGDQADVLEALKFFGVEYPVKDYGEAWKILLQNYRSALQALLEIIGSDGPDSANTR